MSRGAAPKVLPKPALMAGGTRYALLETVFSGTLEGSVQSRDTKSRDAQSRDTPNLSHGFCGHQLQGVSDIKGNHVSIGCMVYDG
ncbi:hypothetical protein J6590_060997 [Homalodisca vitripennis]|nr:hypothetical protein J6590_060997 [Homalodisca vitripennis]